MIAMLKNAWRVPDLRKRILFTVGMLIVFRAGVAVPVPGIIPEVIASLFEQRDPVCFHGPFFQVEH